MSAVRSVRRVDVYGPLAGYAEGFEAELQRLGFTPLARVNQLLLMAHLSRWLQAERVGVDELSVERVESFLRERRASVAVLFTRKALQPLLDWFAASGLISDAVARPALRRDPLVLDRFEEYLLVERRLQTGTAAAHVARVRRFLAGYARRTG